MARIYRTGSYNVTTPHALYLWRGAAGFPTWVGTGDPEIDTPHDEPVPAVTATQYELWEAPHNQPPR